MIRRVLMSKCPDCDGGMFKGDGKCSKCHGSGTLNTILNDISGEDTECRQCRGSGECPTCRGEGLVED